MKQAVVGKVTWIYNDRRKIRGLPQLVADLLQPLFMLLAAPFFLILI